MKPFFKILNLFLIVTIFSNCSQNLLNFPVMSNKENIDELNVSLIRSNAKFTKEIIFIWLIPTGSFKTESVVKEFLREYDADLVKNLEVKADWFHFYFGGKVTLTATGDLFKATGAKSDTTSVSRKSYLVIEESDGDELTEISE